MPKTIIKLDRKSNKDIRKKIRFFYVEKFFNKWMSKFVFPTLNYQQVHYIMKKFWSEGSIACSKISEANDVLAGLMENGFIDMGSNQLIFTPYAPSKRYNIYDFMTHVRLINVRGVKFITTRELEIDKDVVIIYAQKNHKSVYSSIEAKIDELVDIEMKKRCARKSQSQPWLFTFSPEDRDNAKILQEQMDDDNPYLFAPFNDPTNVKGIVSGAPYIVDKLEQDRQKCENDILTMLGVNNVGVGEKKEHLVVDEVNANNEDINQQSYSFQSEIENGFDRVNNCFKIYVPVIDMNDIIKEEEDNSSDDKEDDEDEEN